jgi:hypothetical protein
LRGVLAEAISLLLFIFCQSFWSPQCVIYPEESINSETNATTALKFIVFARRPRRSNLFTSIHLLFLILFCSRRKAQGSRCVFALWRPRRSNLLTSIHSYCIWFYLLTAQGVSWTRNPQLLSFIFYLLPFTFNLYFILEFSYILW